MSTITLEDYLPLVRSIARDFARRTPADYDDLFQEGCIALMRAATYADTCHNFAGYATTVIRQKLGAFCLRDSLLPVPAHRARRNGHALPPDPLSLNAPLPSGDGELLDRRNPPQATPL